jgi:hypothetical protein
MKQELTWKRCVLSSFAVAVLLSATAEVTAYHSSTPHPFNNASITWDPEGQGRPNAVLIYVDHDGNEYTHIRDEEIRTRFRLQASVKSGNRILGFVVTTGDPSYPENLPLPSALIGIQDGTYKRTMNEHRTFVMRAAEVIKDPLGGIHLQTPEQQYIQQCNDEFPGTASADTGIVSRDIQVHAGFSSGSYKGITFVSWGTWWPSHATGRPAVTHSKFLVSIVCSGPDGFRSADLQPGNGGGGDFTVPLQITDVGLIAFQEGTFNPHSGGPMPLPAKVEAACPIEIGLKPIFTHIGTGKVEYRFRFIPQDQTTTVFSTVLEHGYEIQDVYHKFPFPLPAPSKPDDQPAGDIGGFQAQQSDPKGPAIEGGLHAGEQPSGNEHKGSIRVEVVTPKGSAASNWVRYHIVCEPKTSFEPVGPLTAPQKPEQSNELLILITPTPPSPPPAVVIDPPRTPQLACSMGRVVGSGSRATCVCAGGNKPKRVGSNRFACPVVDPLPQLVCTNGRVVGTGARATCVCPRGQERRDLGRNRFRCDRPVVQVTCRGGTVRGTDCVCARTLRKVQTGPNAWRCERPATTASSGPSTVRPATAVPAIKTPTATRPVICQGGTVRRGKCVCPRGQQKAPMAAANAWRCFDPRPARGSSVRSLPAQRSR